MDAIPQIKPKRLCPGNTIGIIAPASPGDLDVTIAGINWLEEQGYQVYPGISVGPTLGYLAGSDAIRAADINAMFASARIDGIICLRGGYGSLRLLELLDYDLIRRNPKVFVGYSDITSLHLSISQQTGLVTFHGPMVAADLGKDPPGYTWDYFLQAVTRMDPLGLVHNPPLSPPPLFLVPGTAEGLLTGGNLSLVAASLGTPYEINTRDKILFLEEITEAPYRIDRMLTQLLLAGKLQNAAGIVFDVCADCDAAAKLPSLSVAEVLLDRLGKLQIPILYNLHFGHTTTKITLPLGVKAILNSQSGGLEIVETATIC